MKFIIHVTISFKNKASSSLQSFQAEHKRQLLSLSFQIKLGFFSFFHPGHTLGSHSALRTFLPQLHSTHNPTLVAADLTVQSIVGRYPNQPGSHTVPGKISTCAQHYWNTLQCTNLDLPKQVAPSKEPCARPSLAVQLQERSVLLSREGCAGLQLTEPARDPASLEGIPLQSGAKMFATGLGHGADRQQLHTAPMTPPAPHLPQPSPATGTSLSPNRALLALHPCKTHQTRNALDFLDMPRSPPQSLLSRSGTFPVPRSTKEPLCTCSVATSPASPGIWQAVPLTTLMEIPGKQAVSQIPLTVSGRKHVWGKSDVW